MTANDFRRLALGLPETSEGKHMGHPDFRVAGKIFATLGYPDKRYAVVRLTPQDQQLISRDHPKSFMPVKGGWGAGGATTVVLSEAKKPIVAIALEAAWRKTAPKKLLTTLKPEAQKP